MLRTRVIPALLLKGRGLVKTFRFKDPKYVGDPINAVRIFNEKEVDELMLLDITASEEGRGPNFELITEIAEECFMPMAYGGGITTLEEIRRLLHLGVEKVVLNSSALTRPELISEASREFGAQAVVASIDVRRKMFGGAQVAKRRGREGTPHDPASFALHCQALGAGEVLLNVVDHDGMMQGMDLKLIHEVASRLSIPLIALGGVGSLAHIRAARDAGASAIAAGSFFVFQGPHKAVLISYPAYDQLTELLA